MQRLNMESLISDWKAWMRICMNFRVNKILKEGKNEKITTQKMVINKGYLLGSTVSWVPFPKTSAAVTHS